MTPLSKKVWPLSKMFGTHSTLLSYLPFDLKIILYFINLWASVLKFLWLREESLQSIVNSTIAHDLELWICSIQLYTHQIGYMMV